MIGPVPDGAGGPILRSEALRTEMTDGNQGRRRGRRRFKAMWRLHRPKGHGGRRSRLRVRRRLLAVVRSRLVRRIAYCVGGTVGVAVLLVGALWWRLSTGPIEMNFVTPWIASAIEENFGRTHKVEIGGTQIERDEHGRAALRIRDIVVRDADGIIVASAPKAEVALSGASLLSGHIRAASLNLVGAEMKLRIEENGDITVFAGAETRPIATAPAPPLPAKKTRSRGFRNSGRSGTRDVRNPRVSATLRLRGTGGAAGLGRRARGQRSRRLRSLAARPQGRQPDRR